MKRGKPENPQDQFQQEGASVKEPRVGSPTEDSYLDLISTFGEFLEESGVSSTVAHSSSLAPEPTFLNLTDYFVHQGLAKLEIPAETTIRDNLLSTFNFALTINAIREDSSDTKSHFIDEPSSEFFTELNQAINYIGKGLYNEARQVLEPIIQNTLSSLPDIQRLQTIYSYAVTLSNLNEYEKSLIQYNVLYKECIEANYLYSARDVNKRFDSTLEEWQQKRFAATFPKMIPFWLNSHEMKQGEPVLNAKRVEQHEYGFSSVEPLGTDNIHQCLIVIIRDKENNQTALAHIDSGTSPQSLQAEVFNKFAPEAELEITLLGSTMQDRSVLPKTFSRVANIGQALTELQKQAEALEAKQGISSNVSSLRNIRGVLGVLVANKERIKDLKAGNIGLSGDDHAYSIIVYPNTGEILRGYAKADYADRWLRDGIIYLGQTNLSSSLRPAHFFAPSPVNINAEDVKNRVLDYNLTFISTARKLKLDEQQMLERVAVNHFSINYPRDSNAKWVKGLSTVLYAYVQEVKNIQAALAVEGIELAEEQIDEHLKTQGINLGEGAQQANLPIIKAIKADEMAARSTTTSSSTTTTSTSSTASTTSTASSTAIISSGELPKHLTSSQLALEEESKAQLAQLNKQLEELQSKLKNAEREKKI